MFTLASGSGSRIEMLKNAGYDFEISPSGFDEAHLMVPPPEVACEKIAIEKAKSVEGKVVLAADTIVWLDNKIIGKPKTDDSAIEMLQRLSNSWYDVYTGVAIVSRTEVFSFYDLARAKFRKIPDVEIENYAKNFPLKNYAGSHTTRGYGATFLEKLDGNLFTILGLPLSKVYESLAKFDIYPDMKKASN